MGSYSGVVNESELNQRIAAYATLAVRKGVNIQQGQELVVTGSVERADFVRLLVEAGYDAGAGHVTVIWSDDYLQKLEYSNMDVAYYREVPSWKREQLNSLAENGAAFLFVTGSDPKKLEGVDPAKPAAAAKATNEQCARFRMGMDFGHNAWSIVGAPVASWAKTVFPDLSAKEGVKQLWKAIITTSRADGDDPQDAWDQHDRDIEDRKKILNDCAFDHLRYRSNNGTDFVIGLNKGHVWEGGSMRTKSGTVFFPNIPTEEVFTSPDRLRCDGLVRSVIPLVHSGNIVRDFWLRFEGGRVVEYDAAEGREVLTSILETDDNACRLGECALIAKNTPIRESGLLFYNTLYDENASCHLALGAGFPECLDGGLDMDRETLVTHGVNHSHTHVDFMIGADDLEITGVTAAGEEKPIFVDGKWA